MPRRTAFVPPTAFETGGGGGGESTGGGGTTDSGADVLATLAYASNGDTNGLVHYLGTIGGTVAFANPAGGSLTATQSSEYSPTYNVSTLTDRNGATIANTLDVANSWWQWALAADRELKVSDYTLRGRSDAGTHLPTAWKLEGSNDGSTWTTLDNVSGVTVPQGGYVRRTVTGAEAFRYFRLTQTAPTNTGSNYFILAEVEFYGELRKRAVPAKPRVGFATKIWNVGPFVATTSGTGALATFTNNGAALSKGTTATGRSTVIYNMQSFASSLLARNPSVSFIVDPFGGGGASAGPVTRRFFVCGDIHAGGIFPNVNAKHFGFELRNNNGTAELYATVANGTARTRTQLAVTVPTVPAFFHAELSNGEVHLYMNGTKVATVATNVPSGALANPYFMAGIYGDSGTADDYCALHYFACEMDAY